MNTLEAYNYLAKQQGLPPMERGGYSANQQSITDPDALWAALKQLVPVEGWLQFQSHQLVFMQGLPEPNDDWGLLLGAEAIGEDGTSITLAQDGAGGWILTRYSHEPHSNDRLVDEITQLAHAPGISALRYRRYWRHDPEQGYVQERALFIGFTEGQ